MGKRFTDIFICRPVLAMVVSLLLLILGIKSLLDLPVRQYPKIDSTLITITTSYPGASSNLIEGFITTRIEKSVASAEGIDYMTSSSDEGKSTINIYVKLNFDPNTAFTDVMSKVAEVQNDLPIESQQPVIQKSTATQTALLYVGFNSDKMSPEQITDYISRVVQPKIETVFGVSEVNILGAKTFAMRIWLNTHRMASLGVTASDVSNALAANNFLSSAGNTKGDYIQMTVTAKTDAEDVNTFKNLVVKNVNGTLIRIRNIGWVQLGSENYDSSVYFNGQKAIFISVNSTPTSNPLTVIQNVKKVLPELEKIYPPTLHSKIVYDATDYIRASIHEVLKTIIEAAIIVVLVIFLFLGSLRAVLIPVVTIPLSLIGVAFFMYMLNYSINLLTLLSMVLAIGMVVDDAIVVVENIYRHIEEGLSPFNAAIKGAREIATAVIAMTLTLAAVYAPIGFMQGLTGALFTEFAFTLAGSIIVSGIIALTLSPMMCSRLLKPSTNNQGFVAYIDRLFERLKIYYKQKLHSILSYRPAVVVVAITVILSCFYLYANTTSELAPVEDQSVLFFNSTAPQYANINYVEKYTNEFNKLFDQFPSREDDFIVNGYSTVNTILGGMILKPWNKRKSSQNQIQNKLQPMMANVAGLQTVVFPLASLPGGGTGLPIQFELSSTDSFAYIYPIAQKIMTAARDSGLFMYVDNSLKYNKPKLNLIINRSKAGDLGITMKNLGGVLSSAMSGNYINRFPMYGQSYKVIPQVARQYRLNPKSLEEIYLTTENDALVPLSNIVTIKQTSAPNSLTHFQQLNSATIQAVMFPSYTIGEGLNFLINEANKEMPPGMTYDFAGQSRQFMQEGAALIYTFIISILVIYLVLSAQFESFRDPFVILISVPMSICGALIPLNLGLATINIYTQIGLITLIGLISKHGILMVEFANQLQANEGLSVREAIEKSAAIRLRPVLMTTASMVFGVVPLILATGAGAVSRFDIGLVIACGMIVGTMFTLFVVPTMYTFFAKKHKPLPTAGENI